MNYTKYATVDVGGTNVRFALFDKDAKILMKNKTQTNINSAEITCDWIIDQVNKYSIEHLALCIPGPSDYKNGIVLKSPNLLGSWVNFDVKNYLLSKTNLKSIVFENDANAMALANHNKYTKDVDVSQFFTISTGFGAGLVINDKIYHGNNYYAQEIAQIPVSTTNFSEKHRLINDYALELHCSGSGIATKAQFYKIANNAKEVFELESTNEIAKKIIFEAKDALTRIFAISAGIIAPKVFFVGGSLALANKKFVIDAFEEAKKISDFNHFNNVELVFDEMGDDSALIGLYYLINQNTLS
ncbi:ROK family protein [Mycoplasma sp. CSL10137]|uniref:ROK family protein n=1 Tax=Mycoplasma sp. CSL10137 TaxID=2813824 RepID=UPI00197C566A|nr:ROK family protein [Mycoplasma sp. CSL10137]MBN4083604.1 ROK family protein [Mycoplasma sp. CSL10137]